MHGVTKVESMGALTIKQNYPGFQNPKWPPQLLMALIYIRFVSHFEQKICVNVAKSDQKKNKTKHAGF